eukprot:3646418-Rhodomonas_salina.1
MADFRHHVTAHLLQTVFLRHDEERFEVFCTCPLRLAARIRENRSIFGGNCAKLLSGNTSSSARPWHT